MGAFSFMAFLSASRLLKNKNFRNENVLHLKFKIQSNLFLLNPHKYGTSLNRGRSFVSQDRKTFTNCTLGSRPNVGTFYETNQIWVVQHVLSVYFRQIEHLKIISETNIDLQ